MRKFLVPILFVLVLVLAGLALWALAGNAGVRGQSTGVLGHSEKHRNTGTVALPPIQSSTTTTLVATPVPSTVPVVRVVTPATTQPNEVVASTTTTTVAPSRAPIATTATTAPPTVALPAAASITATAHIITAGTLMAPDGTDCVASAQVECILLSGTVNESTNLVSMPPPNALTFAIYDNAGSVIGTFTNSIGGGTNKTAYCLINWTDRGTFDSGSSADCKGSPVLSSQIVTGFQYSATFAYIGQQTLTTGELY